MPSHRPSPRLRFLSMSLLLPLLACLGCKDPAALHQQQAEALLGRGEHARAAAELDQAYKANPQLSAEAQKQGAMAWAKAGAHDKAAAILERLAGQAQGSERLRAYQELAAFYVEPAAAFDEAERWYEKALALAPGDPTILTRLAELAATRGGAGSAEGAVDPAQLTKAIERYQQLIELEPRAVAPQRRQREVMVKYLASLEAQRSESLAQAEASQADERLSDDFRRRADEFSAQATGLQGRLEEVDERLSALSGPTTERPAEKEPERATP